MKRQQYLVSMALLLTISTTGFAKSSAEQQRVRLEFLPGADASPMRLSLLDRAFLDVHELLNHDGPCSQFYGGGGAAAYVLDELTLRLQARSLRDTSIGVEMSGGYTSFVDADRGISYRLFGKAALNNDGPFYKSGSFPGELPVPRIGSFRSNTRAARVLLLLHELAHLIKGRNGNWLIPDDGGDPFRSHQNTLLIESRCGEQIRAL